MFYVHILDKYVVEDDSGRVVHLKTQKAFEILVWLLAHDGIARDRIEIAKSLWPDEPQDLARTYLSQNLYFVRQALGRESIKSVGPGLHLQEGSVTADWLQLVASAKYAIERGADHPDLRQLDPAKNVPGFSGWWKGSIEATEVELRELASSATSEVVVGSPRRASGENRWSTRRGAAAVLAIGIMFLATVVLWPRTWAEPQTLDDFSHRLHALTAKAPSQAREEERSRLVEWYSSQCWAGMWTSQEPLLQSVCEQDWPEIQLAFRWSLKRDPSRALRIIGNGHRVFNLAEPTKAWADMIDIALKAAGPVGTIERGRALCGVTLAHYDDNKPRALSAAADAVKLFRKLGLQWDEANALRHQGFALEAQRKSGTESYVDAIKLFRSVEPDANRRGEAMTWESLGERGNDPTRDHTAYTRERAGCFLNAAIQFRLLGNERLALLNCHEWAHELDWGKRTDPSAELYRRGRSEVLFWALQKRRTLEIHPERELWVTCMQIDVKMKDALLLASDLNDLLSEPRRADPDPTASAFLRGAYACLLLRTSFHRPDSAFEQDYPPLTGDTMTNYRRGFHAKPDEIVEIANKFDRV